MKKILAILLFATCFCSSVCYGEVENDVEIHNVIGGLYSLAGAVELNGKINPDVNQLKNFFDNPSKEWLNNIKLSVVKNSIWVGISIPKQSTARKFLRSNSPELGITNEPEGYEWFGGDIAWLKAADIVNKKLKPVKIFAAENDGTIFLTNEAQKFWWQSNPSFNFRAVKEILKRHSAENPPELHKPSEIKASEPARSIYENVKPSGVIRVPDEIHLTKKKNSLDRSIEVGDVIFNPIPTH